MRFQGQRLGYVAGSASDGKSLVLRLPHSDLSKAPRLGDLVLISDEATGDKWLARVERQSHVSIELHEQEVRNAIARGQTSLGAELSDHEKEMYLGHDFDLKLLGEIRDKLAFAPVTRVLPPRASSVNHLKIEDLKQLVTLDSDGTTIGYYSVGDEVHDSNSNQIPVKFSVKRFVSRRTAIFGVAGFGKSNLMKNILAELTVSEPTVGKLVFDLDGEYAFGSRDNSAGHVGLGDIPLVAERLIVYSNARRTEKHYVELLAGEPVLNLGELPARKVVSTLLAESRQDRVYADLMKALTSDKWKKIIELVADSGYETDTRQIAAILGLSHDENLASIAGIIRALVPMLRGHSSSSTMLRDILVNLALGATVIIDLSSMSLEAAYNLTSFVVDELFERNQEAFVAGSNPPEVVVFVEEAQNLLSDRHVKEGNPIARLAKEGRKYNLGLVYVSQQPGAIAKEILSQTNTYFVMHLLSKMDVRALQEINPHYEGVIGDFIQMESLQGHAYIYSTVPGMPIQSYVFGTKANSFADTANLLKSRPPSGASAIRQSRQQAITQVSEILKEILVRATEESMKDGEVKYRSGPISAALAESVPEEISFVRKWRNPKFVDDYWLLEACKFLEYEARLAWENGIPYLYLKERTKAPPIKRPIQPPEPEDEAEIPF